MIFCELEFSVVSHYAEKFVYPRRDQHNFVAPFVVLGLWYDGFNFWDGLVFDSIDFLPVKNGFLFTSHNKWVITDEWKNWSNCDCTKRICPTSYCNPHFADTFRKPLLIKPDVTIPINALSTKDFLFGIHNNDSRRIEVDRVSYGDSKSHRVSICSISRHSFSNF